MHSPGGPHSVFPLPCPTNSSCAYSRAVVCGPWPPPLSHAPLARHGPLHFPFAHPSWLIVVCALHAVPVLPKKGSWQRAWHQFIRPKRLYVRCEPYSYGPPTFYGKGAVSEAQLFGWCRGPFWARPPRILLQGAHDRARPWRCRTHMWVRHCPKWPHTRAEPSWVHAPVVCALALGMPGPVAFVPPEVMCGRTGGEPLVLWRRRAKPRAAHRSGCEGYAYRVTPWQCPGAMGGPL